MALRVDICKKLNHFTLKTQFEASEGVTGILGASGCGKSMTLRCIAGIEKPDEGYIELNGKVFYDSKNKINLRPQERHVGLLFQNYALFPNMTVEQNLMTGLLSGEKDRTKARTRVREMLARFELTGLEKHRPSQLSGGQQQRLCIARALAVQPEVLLMDEPTSALDPISTSKIEDLAMELKKDYTIVMVTHNMQQAVRVSDNTAFFLLGEVIEYNETEKLFSIPADKRTEDYITGRFG